MIFLDLSLSTKFGLIIFNSFLTNSPLLLGTRLGRWRCWGARGSLATSHPPVHYRDSDCLESVVVNFHIIPSIKRGLAEPFVADYRHRYSALFGVVYQDSIKWQSNPRICPSCDPENLETMSLYYQWNNHFLIRNIHHVPL